VVTDPTVPATARTTPAPAGRGQAAAVANPTQVPP
jgi:hypothetical protein